MSQWDIRASLAPQASSWPPIPAHGEQGQPILPLLGGPRHILLDRVSPATTCLCWSPLSSALSHLCWQLGHSRDLLHFGVSHALELASPSRDSSLATVLPDASTQFIHPHTLTQERGEGGPLAAAPGGTGAPGIKLVFCFLPFDKLNCRS